jgi:hypothetical protein
MQVESHRAIVAWTNDNFGPAASNFRVAGRANEEMAEAIRAISSNPQDQAAAVEAADVIIVLCRPALALGLDWGEFVVAPDIVPAKFATTPQYFTWANRWMAQLLCELAVDDNHRDAAETITKIYVALQWAIRQWGLEPADVIGGKMLINRGRQWRKAGDGTGYHIRADKVA